MLREQTITAIIPALNEAEAIALVIRELPDCIDHVIVCDNASNDGTGDIAKSAGATVVCESERGYGAACLAAIAAAPPATDVLLFIDADHSDFPEDAVQILQQVVEEKCDLVIGSRMLTYGDHRALPPVAAFGNWLSSNLIRIIWKQQFTDIGPFRAIRFQAYQSLGMRDRNFGWTIEMQVKAVKKGLRCCEVPVSYRQRIGVSKVSGTITGSVRAGSKFLWIILREAVLQ